MQVTGPAVLAVCRRSIKVAEFTAGCIFKEVSFGLPNLSKKKFCNALRHRSFQLNNITRLQANDAKRALLRHELTLFDPGQRIAYNHVSVACGRMIASMVRSDITI
jgi:hypothetical protein